MTTSSFYYDVNIKNKKDARKLVDALEKAEKFRGKKVVIRKEVKDIGRDEIRKYYT